jgi:hypothetical protein
MNTPMSVAIKRYEKRLQEDRDLLADFQPQIDADLRR